MAKQVWKPGNMLYPVPAVMISCARKGEKPNIITVAWAGTVCSDPAMVSISVRKERYSHDIIKETKEFVINLTTRDLCRATDYCGVRSGRDVDKFKEMHLTPTESQKVKAPGIMESPVNIECKVKQVISLGSHDMFLAEVVAVVIDDEYMNDNGRFDLNSSHLVTYSHGEYYELGKKLGKFGYSVDKRKHGKTSHSRIANNKTENAVYGKNGRDGNKKSTHDKAAYDKSTHGKAAYDKSANGKAAYDKSANSKAMDKSTHIKATHGRRRSGSGEAFSR